MNSANFSQKWNIRPVLTDLWATCFNFEAKSPVTAIDLEPLVCLHFNVSVQVFIHEPGVEYWMHFGLVPSQIVSYQFDLESDPRESVDIHLKRSVSRYHQKKAGNRASCKMYESRKGPGSYLSCLSDGLKAFIRRRANCTYYSVTYWLPQSDTMPMCQTAQQAVRTRYSTLYLHSQ